MSTNTLVSQSADHEIDEIASVDCFDCVVPLPRPLQVGQAIVSSRTYAVVRLRTAAGFEGVAYAFGRGLPVGAIVRDAVAEVLVGADSRRPEAVRELLSGAHWPYAERGLFAVAASAVDLALWDITGKRANLPLADLLGRRSNAVPVCMVGGYSLVGGEDLDGLESEFADFASRNAGAVKLTVGAGSPDLDAERVGLVRRAMGDECSIVVDAFRSFRNLDDALDRLRRIEPFGLAYVEDPFSESMAPLVSELRRRTGLRIGLGETLSGHRAFRDLIASGAVDVVRCDATVIGGIREFMATTALASAQGLEVSTHVHPEIHVHLAAATSNLHLAGLELMLPSSGLDGLHRLLHTQLSVSEGHAVVSARPGLGLEFDWDAVEEFSRG